MTPPPANRTLRTLDDLAHNGFISKEEEQALRPVAERFATAISPEFAGLISTASDPVGRQFIPTTAEQTTLPEERSDPIGDDAFSPIPGIVHRYEDRALLKPLLICPVYCRFCFRREHVGPGGGLLSDSELARALEWLGAHKQIQEVILTGGDPLMLSARRLSHIMQALEAMEHVQTIRIHTRVPTAAPERITAPLLQALDRHKPVWLVVHVNHAAELTPNSLSALFRIQRLAIPVLGQSVLLRGVNDTPEKLEALLRAMVRARIKPYYLHQLDLTPGTSHFHVPIEEGQALLRALRGRVTGLAWPHYVLDIPSGFGKVPIGPIYLEGCPPATVQDPAGRKHNLPRL